MWPGLRSAGMPAVTSSRPTSFAMRSATDGWSPVSMPTRRPSDRSRDTAVAESGRIRSPSRRLSPPPLPESAGLPYPLGHDTLTRVGALP
jgi:hypothetical protein